MLKFKISLLLKNTKFKVAIVALIVSAIVAGIVFIPKNKAGNVSQSVNIMANSSGATVGGEIIYTIERDGNAAGYDNIFCIEEGKNLTYKNYNNPIEIAKAGQYFTNQNSAMWLINNMYLSTTVGRDGLGNAVAKDVLAMNFANLLTTNSVKDAVKAKVGVDYSGVTSQKIYNLRNKTIGSKRPKNALDTIGQIVLWNYTKNANASVLNKYASSPTQYIDGTNLSNDEQVTLKYVYYALKYLADENANISQNSTITNYTTLDKSNAKFDTNTYQVGPYYVMSNGKKITSYSFGEVADVVKGSFPARATVTNFDGSKVDLNSSVFVKKDDGSFYIDLSQYKNTKSVSFVVDYIMATMSSSAYVLDGGEQQNLMVLQKEVGAISLMDTKEVTISGNYTVTLYKVKEDGTTVITSSEAEFEVNGNKQNTKGGILTLASEKTIENAEQKDSYEIFETKAPKGYTAYDKKIKLNVGFKQDGLKYFVDDSKVTLENATENVKVKVSDDKTNVSIYIPNELEPGKFNVELYKVDEKGKLVKTTAKFIINGEKVDTKDGKITIASDVNVESEDDIFTYEIHEDEAPEHYKLFDGIITVKVHMKKTDDGFILTDDCITLDIDKENAGVKFKVEDSIVKIYVPNTRKVFDLSLRKYISKIDDKEVKVSREPVINKQSIERLMKTGTASYYHEKTSLTVRVNSKVEYTIRVYNEGEIEGYTKQIIDYLPEGLTFVKIADSSSNEYTTETAEGSRVVVLNYTGNTNIKSLRDFFGKEEVNVTNEYYQEVKIICSVNQTEQVYITSRAELTNYGYYEANVNGEMIWYSAIDIGMVDIDSIQNTIKEKLDLDIWYENAKENTYVDNNGNTVVDKNYYPGVEDDDDFETVELLTGRYNVLIKKVDADDENKTLQGAYFDIEGSKLEKKTEVGPTNTNGEIALIKGVDIANDNQSDEYIITETRVPEGYKLYDGQIKLNVKTKFDGTNYVIDENNTKVDGKNVKFLVNDDKTVITVIVPNTRKVFDLSLRKFITEVNEKELAESRVPQVDVSKLISGESTTATYNHSKTPVDVNTTDIITYTIRVYNEGELDGYASRIMDDIPEGLEFVPAKFDADGKPENINATYKWILYKEMKEGDNVTPENSIQYNNKTYVITDNVKEASVIVTDYLSKANGENNLLKAFDSKTTTELDYKDVKVSFKVIEPTTSDRIIINYAQITDDTDSKGNPVTDRDSTPNVWEESPRDDDQDIEKIRVRYFDLSLLKWVSKAIVYENGYKTETVTGHTGYENPEPIVKVDLKNTSLDTVEVKFEYTIRITNEGEIAGYAKEISDYIPQGLKFIASDNPQWKEVDGKIVTRALENKLLQPGEYADVTVILTWINNENNLGLKTNIAEISEDYNEFGTPDIDSTPNNKVPDEDDIDDAPVMLTIKTGKPFVYAGIAVAVLAILSCGVVVIKKTVLKK